MSQLPRVEFRVGASDPLAYACALLRAAVAKGARPVVCGPPDQIERLDQQLWSFSAPDFLPHCRVGDALEARSPIVLTDAADIRNLQGRDCLVNLGAQDVRGWEDMPRVIEVVGRDAGDKQAARQRFRAYRQHGCEPQTLELGS